MFGTHIGEIANRSLYVVCSWALRFAVSYEYSVELVERRSSSALLKLDQGFLLTGPLEILSTLIGLSAWTARFLSAPVLYFQIVLFFLPGLYRSETWSFLFIVAVLLGMWLLSATLRFWRMPLLWDFLFGLLPSGNETLDLDLHLRLSEYLGTIRWVFKLINLIVYFPTVLFVLFRFGYLPREWFIKSRRTTVLLCVVMGAVRTPPDILSQLLVASALILFMEVRRLSLYFMINYQRIKMSEMVEIGSIPIFRLCAQVKSLRIV